MATTFYLTDADSDVSGLESLDVLPGATVQDVEDQARADSVLLCEFRLADTAEAVKVANLYGLRLRQDSSAVLATAQCETGGLPEVVCVSTQYPFGVFRRPMISPGWVMEAITAPLREHIPVVVGGRSPHAVPDTRRVIADVQDDNTFGYGTVLDLFCETVGVDQLTAGQGKDAVTSLGPSRLPQPTIPTLIDFAPKTSDNIVCIHPLIVATSESVV